MTRTARKIETALDAAAIRPDARDAVKAWIGTGRDWADYLRVLLALRDEIKTGRRPFRAIMGNQDAYRFEDLYLGNVTRINARQMRVTTVFY